MELKRDSYMVYSPNVVAKLYIRLRVVETQHAQSEIASQPQSTSSVAHPNSGQFYRHRIWILFRHFHRDSAATKSSFRTLTSRISAMYSSTLRLSAFSSNI
nr:hypothetical protein Iba_chr12cCG20160 [Ipomoea batatas]